MTPAKKAPAAKTPPTGASATAGSTKRAAQRVQPEAGASEVEDRPQARKTAGGTKKARPAAEAPERVEAPALVGSGSGASTATALKPPPTRVSPYADDDKFLAEQQALLDHERGVYQGQAADLKAEADSLAQEREPGDVQFDEESGEGGTITVDRERDLALSAQALAAVEEIDDAAARIADRTYGACERCHQPIPKARLRALPYARLCVACKSGGLTRR
ncbi:MAG TPA: TraR/DksA C4-type zinc finger protein [Acidimicrobiales bacterium]|jgi:DnaK suppressor protein